jgi:hypothetical protein
MAAYHRASAARPFKLLSYLGSCFCYVEEVSDDFQIFVQYYTNITKEFGAKSRVKKSGAAV